MLPRLRRHLPWITACSVLCAVVGLGIFGVNHTVKGALAAVNDSCIAPTDLGRLQTDAEVLDIATYALWLQLALVLTGATVLWCVRKKSISPDVSDIEPFEGITFRPTREQAVDLNASGRKDDPLDMSTWAQTEEDYHFL